MVDELINEIIKKWANVPFSEMEDWLNSLRKKYNENASNF